MLKNTILLFMIIFLSGCSQKSMHTLFKEKSNKYNINYKTLSAICKVESGYREHMINVNKSIFNIQRGSHQFDTKFGANLYMDTVLDPLNLNYDVGICQVNSQHLSRMNLDNEDLLDRDINIDVAAKIYNYNVKVCKGNLKCALSMYNTGYKNSSIGMKYGNKVIKTRSAMF